MRGIVLAAGVGNRLRPHTDHLPKALVPIGDDLTPLHLTLSNFRSVGIDSCTIVAGYRADVIFDVRETLVDRYGVTIDVVINDKALEWNNSYSLLVALRTLGGGDALLVNGDTVHPASFQSALLAAPPGLVTLAVDGRPGLADEEMKVLVSAGQVRRISKLLDPAASDGEYVGLSTLPGIEHGELMRCLEAIVDKNPQLYYEDGYQEYIDRGNVVGFVSTQGAPWTEIDDAADLVRARGIVCQY